MKVAVFSTKSYDEHFLREAGARAGHELTFFEPRLSERTCRLAEGFPAVCAFVHDQLSAAVLECLAASGTRLVAMRCAGFNNVDLRAAERLGVSVARVPAYSPHAVAEHTVGLILALSRRLYKAFNRVREGNFNLEGLLGMDVHDKTAGVVGTGRIGAIVARILLGFGCEVLCHDVREDPQTVAAGARYVPKGELLAQSDILTLHCPLMPQTHHMIDEDALSAMKDGVMLVNTSRGALVDTRAAIRALKSGKIGALGLDVYEEEADLFFEDLSDRVIQDDVFARMLTFPNVLITGHQAFFTQGAMEAIAAETIENITAFEQGRQAPGLIGAEKVMA